MNPGRLLNPLHYLRFVGRRLYFTRFNRRRTRMIAKSLSPLDCNQRIADLLGGSAPCLVGRLGGTESAICWHFLQRAVFIAGLELAYEPGVVANAEMGAGISPADPKSLDHFACISLAALPHLDLAAAWDARGMYELLDRFCHKETNFTGLAGLEPWTALEAGARPWTHSLEGQRVLVVHPFAETIRSQFARRKHIKTISSALPDFALTTLVPPVTFAGNKSDQGWVANYDDLCARVSRETFDTAIIGCGAYGLPLGAFVKQMGKKAIHLGGSTQLLFGIRGKRWEEMPASARLMDDSWVRPNASETPRRADLVENACYW